MSYEMLDKISSQKTLIDFKNQQRGSTFLIINS